MLRPLVWSAVFFIAGAAAPVELPLSCSAPAALTFLCGAIALAILATPRGLRLLAAPCLMLGFCAAGASVARASLVEPPGDPGPLVEQFEALFREGVEIAGRVVSTSGPHAGEDGADPALAIDLRIDRVTLSRLQHPVRGTVRLHVPWTPPASGSDSAANRIPAAGSRLEAFARITRPGTDRPGSPLHARVKSPRLLRAPQGGADGERGLATIAQGWRERARRSLLDALAAPFPRTPRGQRAAAVGAALVLGERSSLAPGDQRALAEAGLLHLLAVSGFNVAVLAAATLFLLRGAGAGPRCAGIATLAFLLVYLMLNSAGSSVERAVLMASVWLAGGLVWRRIAPLDRIGLAALVILAIEPAGLGDPGFQLTFAATAALVALVPRFARPPGPRHGLAARLRAALRAALVVTLAAALATFPLTLWHFHRVQPGAIPANLAAGPLMAVAFLASLAIPVVALADDAAAKAVARIVVLLVDGTFLVAALIDRIPFSSWPHPGPVPGLTAIYLLALASLALRQPGDRLARTAIQGLRIAGAGALALLAIPFDRAVPPEGLRITALDVGQGDALLIESPGGARVLVDAGGRSRRGYDAGERQVAPALWRRGIVSLDLLVVTHDDLDHAGGAASVARLFAPRRLWMPEAEGRESDSIERLTQAVRSAGGSLERVGPGGSRCMADLCIRVLGTPSASAYRRRTSNDRSLILSIRSGGDGALFMGDAGEAAEAGLDPSRLPAAILKVGHHGSRTSTSAPFLEKVRPRVALLSVGRGNPFGHPHREVLDRLGDAGARICRTDAQGETGVELLAGRIRLSQACALRP